MHELEQLFGKRIFNALQCLGINSKSDLRRYAILYPFYDDPDKKYSWSGIGPKYYNKIVQFLEQKEDEKRVDALRKRHGITAAKDLGYGPEVIEKLKNVIYEKEFNDILIGARRRFYND